MNRTIATAIVTLALLIMAGVPATAEASSTDQAQTDLSSLPKIEAYLGSMGIDLDSVVVQQGQLNYAGPNCPGAGWNCTTATMVVQITTSIYPAANIFDCLPAANATFPALNECLIVQSSVLDPLETASLTNSAECGPDLIGEGGKSKSKCTIRQTSKKGNNYAVARMRTTQRGGSPQSATQEADITQTSDSGSNTAKITQTIHQELDAHELDAAEDDVLTQKQDARQFANVSQMSGSGANSSDVQQTMRQLENAQSSSSITQEQNKDSLEPNQETTVTQTSTSGTHTSNLRWQLTQRQDAKTSAACVMPTCTVTQNQGSAAGGQKGTVTQTTGPVVIVSIADQNEDQQQDADTNGTWIHVQIGPEFCCATQNGGTAANVNRVTQSSVQQSGTGGSQTSRQHGECIETTALGAECSLFQTYTNNSGTNTFDPEPATFQFNDRSCTTGEGGEPFCTEFD